MEKRVKIIWVLTLVSGLLLICGQAYWLFNQYRYQVDRYAKESYEEVLEAIRQETAIRRDTLQQMKTVTSMTMTYLYLSGEKEDLEGKDSLLRQFGIDLNVFDLDSLKHAPGILEYEINDSLEVLQKDRHISVGSYDGEGDKRLVGKNTDYYYLSSPNAKPYIQQIMETAQLQRKVPFRTEVFDSLLSAGLEDVTYSLERTSYAENDTWMPAMELQGNTLRPVLRIDYPYDPLRREGITVKIEFPSPPVLKRMGWQLAGSLGLILLLFISMLFQTTTIVKQYRIDKLRKNFTHTMIHELRRPVQTLKMFVSLLRDKETRNDETTIAEVLRDSMFELDNLSAYLGKLKDMTQVDYEDTPLQKVSFDLKELVEKVIRLIPRPTEKKIRLVPTYDMEQPCVTADPVHVANMIQNLIENSIKYSTEEVEIDISCRLHEGKLEITVSDNGFGIPATEQTRVFDKFYRGQQATGSDIPGIGLGLSYVKLITEAHRGEVNLRTESGKGTAVTLLIPQYG